MNFLWILIDLTGNVQEIMHIYAIIYEKITELDDFDDGRRVERDGAWAIRERSRSLAREVW
ncbi:MAG: hypothetical protein CVV52_04260 [Spirochaetae bacterium HGW-Spirochaetae-8]|jgi:hypothetical protein|nr:MAG: hypothetical protein CVV52_04260 [Spirochaetae bacterium HGW-Spirochaetae-8]